MLKTFKCVGKFVCVCAALSALTACGWAEWPPPSERGPVAANRPMVVTPNRTAARSRPVHVAPTSVPGSVIAAKGDSVYGLARRYNVSVRGIIDANAIVPPYGLQAGQRITLPKETRHRVAKGDSLWGIATRFDVDRHELARINALKPPYTIQIDQWLRIPRVGGIVAAPKPEAVIVETRSAHLRTVKQSAPPMIAKPAPTPKPRTVTNRKPSKPVKISTPPKRTGKGFLWPVKGKVISSFGVKTKGLYNDGINIAAPRGTPVLAAENGVVVYVGNELRGFGNLVLIKHSGGWISAYAHTQSIAIKRGERVRKGKQIAKVGSSGSVASPQLHFELRRGKRAVDPKRYLKRTEA